MNLKPPESFSIFAPAGTIGSSSGDAFRIWPSDGSGGKQYNR